MLKRLVSKNKVRVAINGFGRIGRAAFKVLLNNPNIEVAAINDLVEPDVLVNLLQYDSVYGKYNKKISGAKDGVLVDGKKYPVYAVKNPSELPWKQLGIDVVLECTGIFRTTEKAGEHLKAGAKKVIISAPAKDKMTKTIVLGVNENKIKKTDKIISMASCTTNCLAPITDCLQKSIGIKKAIMTTVHGYTAGQNLVDGPNKDPRRARAAAINIVPTTTGAAIATTETIPELEGKFDGMAMRVPVPCGSIVDAVYLMDKKVSEQKINEALRKYSGGKSRGILIVTKEPLVSTDIIGNPASAIVDLNLTKVVDGDLVKVVAWYDNEWGYSNRLAEMTEVFGKI
ncbi:MAG: type I glyceraldehyde-3-phosphate dehydrogenase [Patescibacteria group bacterium]|jgi:glyceraldehyde 3-phosphate dehydrogenase